VNTVWGITTGEYSDYRVQALFATEDAAKRAAALRDDHADISAFNFYSADDSEPKLVQVYYHNVELWDDGTQGSDRAHSDTHWEYDGYESRFMDKRPYVRFVRAPMHHDKGGRLEVYGINEKACLKTVSDYIAQWKAQGYRLSERNR
jgi:hypothetical protein